MDTSSNDFRAYLEIALNHSGLQERAEPVEHPDPIEEIDLVSVQVGPVLIWEEHDSVNKMSIWHADMVTTIYDNHGIPGPSEAMGDYHELISDKSMTEVIVNAVMTLVEERIRDEFFNYDMDRFYSEEIETGYVHQEQGVQ